MMEIYKIEFKDDTCFKNHGITFDLDKKLTLIIGKNNTGKSRYLHCFAHFCNTKWNRLSDFIGYFKADEKLAKQISSTAYGSIMLKLEKGESLKIQKRANTTHCKLLSIRSDWNNRSTDPEKTKEAIERIINGRINLNSLDGETPRLDLSLLKHTFRLLTAERDIIPEKESTSERLNARGEGATNLVRRFCLSAAPLWDRNIVAAQILNALNEIFYPDSYFNEIVIKQHESSTYSDSTYEIFLGEEHKGLVALSQSGSGLKTVLLVLLNLIAIPHLESKKPEKYVFAFEELENNLHPAVLRRLLNFIHQYVQTHQARIFLTSHSSLTLDFFSQLDDAQIIQITHDGENAKATTISNYFECLEVIKDLGNRPSDLFQANGILWLEGPSDRIYLNKWIELMSDGRYKEGQHYQCVMYGGALLAHNQFCDPTTQSSDLANLLPLNPNFVLICDSDKKNEADELKKRVAEKREEIEQMPIGHYWILEAKEIENYLPGNVIASATNIDGLPDPKQHEIFYSATSPENYVTKYLNRKSFDKIAFARCCTQFMTDDNMSGRFAWKDEMEKIIAQIKRWNGDE